MENNNNSNNNNSNETSDFIQRDESSSITKGSVNGSDDTLCRSDLLYRPYHVGRLGFPDAMNRSPEVDYPMRTNGNYVFLSHTGKDGVKEDLARPTKWFLENILGVKNVFLDEENSPWGVPKTEALVPPAYRCTHALVIISPTFIKRKYCIMELNTFMARFRSRATYAGPSSDRFRLMIALWRISKLKDYHRDVSEADEAPIRIAGESRHPPTYMLHTLWPKLCSVFAFRKKSTAELSEFLLQYIEESMIGPHTIPKELLQFAQQNSVPRVLRGTADHEVRIVGISFSAIYMEDNVDWNRHVLARKHHIEEQMKKIVSLRSCTITYGRPVVEGKLKMFGSAVARLEIEVEVKGGLDERVTRAMKSIAGHLRAHGVSDAELEQLMIGTAWRGSLWILFHADTSVLEKLHKSLRDSTDCRFQLGVGVSMTALIPAFVFRVVSSNILQSNRGLPFSLERTGDDVLLWENDGLSLLIPLEPSARSTLVGGGISLIHFLSRNTAAGECEWEQVLTGHSDTVTSASWSPDGRRIASGSADKTVRVWDAATGECEQVLTGHSGTVTSVSWSPGGRHIASGSGDKTVRVWEAVTGECERVSRGHSHDVTSASWSPDGRHIASGSADKTVRVWDATTGECEQVLTGHSGTVTSVSWSPEGRHIASGLYDGTALVWDAATFRDSVNTKSSSETPSIPMAHVLTGHSHAFASVSRSPDGLRVASCSADMTIRIWNASSGQCEQRLPGHPAIVTTVSWSQFGDRPILGTKLDVYPGSQQSLLSVGFSKPSRAELSIEGGDTKLHLQDGTWVEVGKLDLPPGSHVARPTTKEPRVYISYATSDGAYEHIVQPTCWFLSQVLKVEVFFCRDRPSGLSWSETLHQMVYGCTHALIILSPSFIERENCVMELNTLVQRVRERDALTVLPVLWHIPSLDHYHRDVNKFVYLSNGSKDVSTFLLDIVWPNLCNWFGYRMKSQAELREHLLRFIESHAGASLLPELFLSFAKESGLSEELLRPHERQAEMPKPDVPHPVIVGVSFSSVFMDNNKEWNSAVLANRFRIERVLRELMTYGRLTAGRENISLLRTGLFGALARLECEIELRESLTTEETSRIQELLTEISNFLKYAGATDEDVGHMVFGST